MSNNKISSSSATDRINESATEIAPAQSTTEAEYQCDWNKWNGYYEAIEDLQNCIDKKAIWTVGKGFSADEETKKQLQKIKGFGKDTFNTIMSNQCRVYTIAGDSFSEIIATRKGILRNLKPLNPGSIKIIANDKGCIKRYEQFAQYPNETSAKIVDKFKPEEIFHLPWNRIADGIHGTSTIKKLESVIIKRQEAMTDLATLFHRYVKPVQIIPIDEDDTTKVAAFKAKYKKAYEDTEIIVVPKDTVDTEHIRQISIPQYSTLDPLPWLNYLDKAFLKAEGVPEVILGYGGDTTEATSKILYLGFQQVAEWNQLFLEENIKAQLGLDVEFEFPADIAPDLASSQTKARKTNNFEMENQRTK